MSGMDEVLINTRERPVSADINNLQAMTHREVLDMMRRGMSPVIHASAFGTVPTSSPRAVVLGGLEVTASGTDVNVQPGVLLQDSSTLAPTPGALDSNYRVGVLRSATLVDMPDPGATSYIVIEAQMVQVTTLNESRDVLDPGTGNFVATLVDKQKERRLQFQILTGVGTVPAFTGGDWVPIAVVRRPGGGGAVANTDIYDIRPMWQSRMARSMETALSVHPRGRRGACLVRTASTFVAGNTVSITDAEAYATSGERMWAAGTEVDISAASILENGLALAGDTWYYLYLAPFRGVVPRNAYGAAVQTTGLLVLSAVAPLFNGINGGAITPSAPWNTSPAIAAGEAVCVAAVWRNSLNTGWVPMWTADGHHFYLSTVGPTTTQLANFAPPATGDNNVPSSAVAPNVRAAIITLSYTGAAGAPAAMTATIQPVGTAVPVTPSARFDDGSAANNIPQLVIPFEAMNSKAFDVNIAGAPNAGSTLLVQIRGYVL